MGGHCRFCLTSADNHCGNAFTGCDIDGGCLKFKVADRTAFNHKAIASRDLEASFFATDGIDEDNPTAAGAANLVVGVQEFDPID